MFFCDGCGLCCKNIGGIKELEQFLSSDGSCINLDKESNLCRIYNDRPLICRVDELYEAYYFKYFSKDEFYKINEKSCQILKNNFKG